MDINKYLFSHNNPSIVHYTEDYSTSKVCSIILPHLQNFSTSDFVVVCIGTDRCTGDSLGPLVGTKLLEKGLKKLILYGTLDNPVHALNLSDVLIEISSTFSQPFIIGVDACLGKKVNIGNIEVGLGPVRPGVALKKELPPVGDMFITGIVNIGGFMEFSVLQNTRLSIVNHIANTIAGGLYKLDRQLFFAESNLINRETLTKKASAFH